MCTVGTKDEHYEYSQNLKEIYGSGMEWFEFEGPHETPKDAELNTKIAAAIWRALSIEFDGVEIE